MGTLEPLMRQNFLEYASYVIVDRAIPELRDGLKPVQRRILHTLFTMNDGRFHKVANVIGETMKFHPHGDASIADALVVLANKDYFIEKQGNFGNPISGHRAAAPRYIECRLTGLALETMFSKALTEYMPSYDGRRKEPLCLPAKLPVALLLGTEGIAVGMATKILPHNIVELWRGQVALLRKQKVTLHPDFPQGGLMDVSEYADGRGKVKLRARIEQSANKKLVIREIPYSTTTESLIASIESAIQKGKVKIASINDFTSEKVEIELTLVRGASVEEVIAQLYAYTDCEVSISSNIVLIHERRPHEMAVTEVLSLLTQQLKAQLKAELEHDLKLLQDKQHWMTLERIFIENRVYKRLEQAKSEEKLRSETYAGMKPFSRQFLRPMDDEDVKRLLALPIRRISAFDIAKHSDDMQEVAAGIKKINTKLRNMTKTTVSYIEDLARRYGSRYPRRTKLSTFETIDKKAVARQNIKLSYDPKSSFFGSQVRGSAYTLTVSEYDKILAISDDGSYRIMSPPNKVLLSGKALYCDLFDTEQGAVFTVVYRDKAKNAYAKKVHIARFIHDKEYQLIKDKAGKIDLLIPGEAEGKVLLHFVPVKRQKIKGITFDLSDLEFCGISARGTRLATKPVAKVTKK